MYLVLRSAIQVHVAYVSHQDYLFSGLYFLPDLMPKEDHYIPFEEIYGKETSEKFRVSTVLVKKIMQEVVECEECGKKTGFVCKEEIDKS